MLCESPRGFPGWYFSLWWYFSPENWQHFQPKPLLVLQGWSSCASQWFCLGPLLCCILAFVFFLIRKRSCVVGEVKPPTNTWLQNWEFIHVFIHPSNVYSVAVVPSWTMGWAFCRGATTDKAICYRQESGEDDECRSERG